MTKATGSFKVLSGGEEAYDKLETGVRLTHASGAQAFSGDIEGDGSVHWLMLYRPDKTAHMVGLQRITGTIGGRRGSCILAAEGDHDGSGSRIALTVVRDTGTDELAGIVGAGELVAPGGAEGTYELEYEFALTSPSPLELTRRTGHRT